MKLYGLIQLTFKYVIVNLLIFILIAGVINPPSPSPPRCRHHHHHHHHGRRRRRRRRHRRFIFTLNRSIPTPRLRLDDKLY